jgi:hypothetical protein
MWQQLFGLTNAIAVVAWALLLFGLRRWLSPIRYAGVGLLCVVYAALFAALLGGLVDPVRDAGAPASMTDYSVKGLRALFASDGGIVVGWTHYLAFDLFVGTWIAEEADRRGFGRLVQAPILFLTFMAGPLGLLVWFLVSRGKETVCPPR